MTALAEVACAWCGAAGGALVGDDGDMVCPPGDGCARSVRRPPVVETRLPARPMEPHQVLSAVDQVRAVEAAATYPTCAEGSCWARVARIGDRCVPHYAAAEGLW